MASQPSQSLSFAGPRSGSTSSDPPLLFIEEARSRIIRAMRELGEVRVNLAAAWGRVLAQDIVATHAHPPAAVSAMDGYALRSADALGLPVRLKKIGVSKAGARFDGKVSAGSCVRIFTGATLPDGVDTIALQEDANELGDEVEIRQI